MPQSYARQFEELNYQRSQMRLGQSGVSVIYPPRGGPDEKGDITFFGTPEAILGLLKTSSIPHLIISRAA